MKYQSVDHLNDFSFDEAAIFDVDFSASHLKFQLANVTILSTNQHNRDIMDMRTNDLILTFEEPVFSSIIEEGYKIYDANENLIEEIPDTVISQNDYPSVFSSLIETTIYSIESITTEHCIITTDSSEDTNGYRIELTFQHSIAEWDHFLKKELF